jgi:hypothetical protein
MAQASTETSRLLDRRGAAMTKSTPRLIFYQVDHAIA